MTNASLGIPDWILNPINISRDLNDESSTLDVQDATLGFSDRLQKRCQEFGARRLFPVQKAIIQQMLQSSLVTDKNSWKEIFTNTGRNPCAHPGDILVSAPTGSGKTLAYVLPIVESLSHRTIPCLRALIVLPTRDLVSQVKKTFDHFVKGTDLRVVAVKGGSGVATAELKDSLAPEQEKLVFKNDENNVPGGLTRVDILITTPGRLVEHLANTRGFTLQHLQWLVIDEADRLLNQNYNNWLKMVLDATERTPSPLISDNHLTTFRHHPYQFLDYPGRDLLLDTSIEELFRPVAPVTHLRKLLFSATLTRHPGKLASLRLLRPCLISTIATSTVNTDAPMDIDGTNEVTENVEQQPHVEDKDEEDLDEGERFVLPSTLEQFYFVSDDASEKPLILLCMLLEKRFHSGLCFTQSIENAERLFRILNRFSAMNPDMKLNIGYYASTKTPAERTKLLKMFNQGKIDLLICTDALARGMDLTGSGETGGVQAVINYDPPVYIKTYVHRAGRTARAGRTGQCLTLLSGPECRHWKKMMRKHQFYALHSRISKHTLSERYQTIMPKYQECLEVLKTELGIN